MDGRTFTQPYVGQALLGKLRGGVATQLSIVRAGKASTVSFTPAARPLEVIEGVDTRYGSVTVADGTRLRTLTARRAGLTGPLPPLLFTQWVSCGTLEYRKGYARQEHQESGADKQASPRSAGGVEADEEGQKR